MSYMFHLGSWARHSQWMLEACVALFNNDGPAIFKAAVELHGGKDGSIKRLFQTLSQDAPHVLSYETHATMLVPPFFLFILLLPAR